MIRTAMAGIAGYSLPSSKVRLIDRAHHLHHRAGAPLAGIIDREVLPFAVVGRVAVFAGHSQRYGENAHGAHEFVDWNPLEHLDVLEHFFRHLGLSGRHGLGPCQARANVNDHCALDYALHNVSFEFSSIYQVAGESRRQPC
jgi:hypothetical protein